MRRFTSAFQRCDTGSPARWITALALRTPSSGGVPFIGSQATTATPGGTLVPACRLSTVSAWPAAPRFFIRRRPISPLAPVMVMFTWSTPCLCVPGQLVPWIFDSGLPPAATIKLPMRAWNRAKLLWGYLTRRARLDALPVEYIVETTAKCNLYCPMCPRETHPQPKADMTDEVFRTLLAEAGDTAEHMMLIGLGEPFMDPKIFERIEYCHRHSVSTLLSTNGTFLDERYAGKVLDSPLEQITLSFDGFKKETFEFYRKGAKFEKVRDNFVRFARMKHERGSNLQVVVQMARMDCTAAQATNFLGSYKTLPTPTPHPPNTDT